MRLKEIDIIRPFFIILLVTYHAFIIFGGGWEPVEGYRDIPVYKTLAGLSYSFMLEGFVLISGYVYGYQVTQKGIGRFMDLLKKKSIRLLLPAWIWSLVYVLTLSSEPFCIVSVISGTGHLWFLVMLFWVFVIMWIVQRMGIKNEWLFPLLLISALLSYNPLPFQLSRAMYYCVFFWAGMMFFKKRTSIDGDGAAIMRISLLAGGGIF